MLKGMKTGIVCLVLAMVLVAPATFAQGWSDTYSPATGISEVLKNVYQGIQNALADAWTATFGASEGDEAEAEPTDEVSDPTLTLTSDPPPPPANNGDGDDDGNGAGGMDPFG